MDAKLLDGLLRNLIIQGISAGEQISNDSPLEDVRAARDHLESELGETKDLILTFTKSLTPNKPRCSK
jgi:hypothetical protein